MANPAELASNQSLEELAQEIAGKEQPVDATVIYMAYEIIHGFNNE